MRIGFNEGCDRYCEGHTVLNDLEFCEKYGFDCIDIQSECLDRDLAAGKCTLEQLGEWFRTHHLSWPRRTMFTSPPTVRALMWKNTGTEA